MRCHIASLLLASSLCCGQEDFTIALDKANAALAIPSMTARDGVVYIAYRTFDLLRFSSTLRVLAYDLSSRKELRHATIAVPKVHGARSAEGLFLSEDGRTLAYAELYEPSVIVLFAANTFAEVRRS